MSDLASVSLDKITEGLRRATQPVRVLWQTDDTLAFVARGRPHRSEFHSDPVDEVMYMIKGRMNLHYRTPAGEEKIAVLDEGDIIHCPAGIPHSPRFSPDAFVLVLERRRRADERDRFSWFCEHCAAPLYESVTHVTDYDADPVSRAYEEFYGSETNRTCSQCGHVTPRPTGV
jgi:3-hydroxyanthranilate 3,4-dioxygenase